jgi:hypothetical protein
MSILKKSLSLLNRKKTYDTLTDITPQETAAEPVPTTAPPPGNVIFIYSHGFTNGVYQIAPDKDSFETFLEYCNQLDKLRDQREVKEKSIVELDLRLNAATAAYSADGDTFIEREGSASNVSLSLAELEQRRLKKEQKEAALVTQVKETNSEYSWVPALFYFAAGFVFIIADISITKQITSWGFNMEGWQSWIFAIGLAFTAFLIKPTIDRLLEKPFQVAGFKLKTLYKCVLLGVTVVGLIMLYCLGKFRSDSEIARNNLAGLLAKMSTEEPNSPHFIGLQNEYDAIQKSLDENSMGQAGLILSGMLFAIGSAICLSIAFGSLKQLINRYWILPIRIRQVKKEIKVMDQQVIALRLEHTSTITEQKKAEKRLLANEIPVLKEELKKLQEERSILLTEFYQAQYEKERSLYQDGKNKGEKHQIEGDLLYKVSGNEHSSLYLGKEESKDENSLQTSPRPYTRRPFVKMRKMIADNFNKNQNTQTYDGTEFEIIS